MKQSKKPAEKTWNTREIIRINMENKEEILKWKSYKTTANLRRQPLGYHDVITS